MKRFVTIVVSMLGLAWFGPATASPRLEEGFADPGWMLGDVLIPSEWDGVWAATESSFVCPIGEPCTFLGVETQEVTFCGGKPLLHEPDGIWVVDCSGSATTTTMDVECTAEGYDGACYYRWKIDLEASRVGDRAVVRRNALILAEDAEGVPCVQADYRLVGTWQRIGPAPSDYCATPAESATWGKVKARYR